jgi:hypothetical protein
MNQASELRLGGRMFICFGNPVVEALARLGGGDGHLTVDIGRQAHKVSCSSGQRFAAGFIQTPLSGDVSAFGQRCFPQWTCTSLFCAR